MQDLVKSIRKSLKKETPSERTRPNPAVSIKSPQIEKNEEANEPQQPHELVALIKWIAHVFSGVLQNTANGVVFTFSSALRYIKRYPVHTLSNVILAALLVLFLATGSKINQSLIDQKMENDTISKLIEASVYTRDYRLGDIQSRGVREFLRVGGPKWSQYEGMRAVLQTARQYDLSLEHQAVLLAIVEIESGFSPVARASTTSACGLFQFVKATGRKFGLTNSDCLDPWLNAKAGVEHYRSNYKRRVKKRVDDLEGTEKLFKTFELSYYLHHDGPLSSNPSNDLKATVLTGTSFLLQAFDILNAEAAAREEEKTFLQLLADEFRAVRNLTFIQVAEASNSIDGFIFGG